MSAKHEVGTTLGMYPQLYPYVLAHTGEKESQIKLRDKATTLGGSGMMGSPDEAQFLAWLVRTMGFKKILEVGVFRGTTTLSLALALKDIGGAGKIVGLDLSDEYATIGKQAWVDAGVNDLIDFRVGAATDSLDKLIEEGNEGSFDLAFIDADKQNYPFYYERCLRLLRVGGVIAVDNVLWGGHVLLPKEKQSMDARTISNLNEFISNDKRVSATMLPIADGVYLCTKL